VEVDVPELVRQRALANSSAGRSWLDDLPDIVAGLAERWDLELGKAFAGGTAAYVVEAIDGHGEACVLKIAMPLDLDELAGFERSIVVHQLADGRACANLLDYDTDAPAMLLERLGPNLADLGYSIPSILEVVATTLQSFWRPAPDDDRLPTGADKAAWLADHITSTWSELAKPCTQSVIDRAVAYCEERAGEYDPTEAILVHGDAHGWNTLEAADGRFKFVDPEGVRSERAHDLAVPMREYNGPLLAGDTFRLVRERAEYLGAVCGVDPEPVWQWGFIERVSTGLAGLRDFDDDTGQQFLEVAERCL
jgi:streptomycin 6-kinase